MIATHLGVIDEEQIDNMSYLLFDSVLEELGKKLNYEAVVNYAGNSFMKDSWKVIKESFPMSSTNEHTGASSIASFLNR